MNAINKYTTILFGAILLLTIASCKKDSTTGISVTGKYRVVNSSNPLPEYLLFYDNNTYSSLIQSKQGAHKVIKGVYSIHNNTLTQSEYYSLYLIEQTGDTLKLLASPGQPSTSDKILVADAASPTEETWVQTVTPTTLIATANLNPSSMAVVGTKLYTVYEYETYMHVFDLAANMELPQIVLTEPYRSITNSGGVLYSANSTNKLVKLNTDGSIIMMYGAVTSQMYALAGNGPVIYSYNTSGQRFGSFNTSTATNADEVNFEQTLTSLCYKGGYLYGTAYNYIYKIDLATYAVVKSYHLPDNLVAQAIASDGTNFWINVSSGYANTGYIAKITLD